MNLYRAISETVLAAKLASGEWLILPDGGEPVEVPADLFYALSEPAGKRKNGEWPARRRGCEAGDGVVVPELREAEMKQDAERAVGAAGEIG